jgi:hypothetical protein
MTIVLNGTTGITNDGGYTGDGVVFADSTPANTLVTDTSGNVGIGTASPAYNLDIVASGNSTSVQVGSGDNGIIFTTTGNKKYTIGSSIGVVSPGDYLAFNHYNGSSWAERMRIDSSGRLLINTTSSLGRLTCIGGVGASGPAGFFSTGFSGDVSTTGMRIDKFDNNTTTSQIFINFSVGNNTVASGQINANGSGAAAFGSWSDSRLKENITALPSQLDNIIALRPVEFDYIESEGGGHQIGFIAQEMQEVYPDAVGERSDGMLTVTGWSKTEARLVKAIQEQQAIITDLKSRIETLEAK